MAEWVLQGIRRGDGLVPLLLTIGLVCLSQYSFLLFHTSVELFSIIVATTALAIMWHAHDYMRNPVLLVLSSGLFWLAQIDFLHALTYKGMNLLPSVTDANLPTQLWIGGRWLEALVFVAAPSFVGRPVSKPGVFAATGVIGLGLIALILLGAFPDAYLEGQGLTPFKVYSEYLIVVVLICAAWRFYRVRDRLGTGVTRALALMIALTAFSELAFTAYVNVYGFGNLIGHILKFWAFWTLYVAIVRHPLSEVFRATLEQRDTAQRLGESEARFRTLVANLPGVCYRCAFDRDWTMEYISDRVEALTGYPADGFIANRARSFASIIHPDDVAAVAQGVAAGVAVGRSFAVEYRIFRADGTLRWVCERGRPVYDQAGRLRCLDGVIEDVTERVMADRRLQQAASVFEHCNEGILITDTDARIIDVNQAFAQLTGYAREEVLGKTPSILGSGRQPAEFYEAMWDVLRRKGVWKGELWNRRKDGSLYAELLTISAVLGADDTPSHYVGIFSDITHLKQDQEKLKHLANHDHLTKTPNRLLLADRLHQAQARTRRQGGLMAVAYLDLDGFKAVNDRSGHEIGDQLLVQVAERLTASVRALDTVARIGGDEFVLVLTDLKSLAECRQILGRVLTVVARPYRLAGVEVAVSASIGVAYCASGETDPDLMLRWADVAMYKAKEMGRNRLHFHHRSPDFGTGRAEPVRSDFAHGLASGQFELHYQPKVDLRRGCVIGVEGLIRWRIGEGHWRAPGEFLPAIEGTEHDLALGWWVLREAVRQHACWQRLGLDLPISVNISAWHLGEDGFFEGLKALLAESPELPAGRLELEILETTALRDVERVSAVLARCLRLGVRFALDDFGTGYSSLENFRKLPVGVVKIDRSFVGDMLADAEAFAIVEGIVSLSRAFRREVVAEGLETVECGQALLRLGCERAQGYGIARPMPAVAIPAWVGRYRSHPAWQGIAAHEPAA